MRDPWGQRLLAHELTHTVQQGGAGKSRTAQTSIQRWPDWVSDAADWVVTTASDTVDSVVEGAEWVGGQVSEGAEWVGGEVAAGNANGWAIKLVLPHNGLLTESRNAIDSGTQLPEWKMGEHPGIPDVLALRILKTDLAI